MCKSLSSCQVVMGYKTNTFPVTEDDTLSQFSVPGHEW